MSTVGLSLLIVGAVLEIWGLFIAAHQLLGLRRVLVGMSSPSEAFEPSDHPQVPPPVSVPAADGPRSTELQLVDLGDRVAQLEGALLAQEARHRSSPESDYLRSQLDGLTAEWTGLGLTGVGVFIATLGGVLTAFHPL